MKYRLCAHTCFLWQSYHCWKHNWKPAICMAVWPAVAVCWNSSMETKRWPLSPNLRVGKNNVLHAWSERCGQGCSWWWLEFGFSNTHTHTHTLWWRCDKVHCYVKDPVVSHFPVFAKRHPSRAWIFDVKCRIHLCCTTARLLKKVISMTYWDIVA